MRAVPIASWIGGYRRSFIVPDTLAGLTVWALLVPESMAYASIAGVPVQFGLYSVPLAIVGYAVFGASKQLFVGPSSTVAVLTAATVAPLAVAQSPEYVALVATLALLVGALYVVLGLLRMGFVARFFAKPVLDGFIVGLGLFIAIGQLHKLVGIGSSDGDTVQQLWDVVSSIGAWSWVTVAVGFSSLAALFLLEKVLPRLPGALVVVVLAIVVSEVADLANHGVAIVGDVPTGFHFVSWSPVTFDDTVSMVPGALGIIVVGFAQSIAIAKSLAATSGERVDADQEMIGYGMASIGAGALQGYTSTGSLSKSAAARQAGARTPVAYLVSALFVVLTILLLAGLFESLPEAVLGAIVIHAVWGMIDFAKLVRLWKVHTPDFWLALGAVLGVVIVGILAGIVIGVGLSLALFVHRLDKPHIAVLGRRPDGSYRDVDVYDDADPIDDTIVCRLDAPLIFANADAVADDVRLRVRESEPKPSRLVLDLEAVYEIDTQGADVLAGLHAELAQAGVDLVLARPHAAVGDFLARVGVGGDAGDVSVYPTVPDAVGDR